MLKTTSSETGQMKAGDLKKNLVWVSRPGLEPGTPALKGRCSTN